MLLRIVLGVAALVLGFLGGVQAQHVVAASGEAEPVLRAIDPSAHRDEVVLEDCPRLPTTPPYPVNENGMTYGSGAGIDEDDPGPALVSAYGTDGRCGFVRASDLRQPATTLAQALTPPAPGGRDVPLYAQDGVTVIGTYRSGQALTSGAPEPPRSSP
jgi:hypothetical protein